MQIRLHKLPSQAQLIKLTKEVCSLLNKPTSAMLLDVQQSNVTMGEQNGAVCHIYSAALNENNQPKLSKCIGETLKALDIDYKNHYIFFHKMSPTDIGWNLSLKSIL